MIGIKAADCLDLSMYAKIHVALGSVYEFGGFTFSTVLFCNLNV